MSNTGPVHNIVTITAKKGLRQTYAGQKGSS
jgi:hypothetical protein